MGVQERAFLAAVASEGSQPLQPWPGAQRRIGGVVAIDRPPRRHMGDFMPPQSAKGVWVFLAILVVACGGTDSSARSTSGDTDLSVVPLAKVEGHRDGRHLFTLSPPLHGVLEIAFDPEAARQAWGDNTSADLADQEGLPEEPGIYGDLTDVDFETHVIAVWSSGESSTCPGWVSGVEVDDEGSVDIALEDAGDPSHPCPGDYNPYRMLFAIERERVPSADELPTHDVVGREHLETDVLVAEYPGY